MDSVSEVERAGITRSKVWYREQFRSTELVKARLSKYQLAQNWLRQQSRDWVLLSLPPNHLFLKTGVHSFIPSNLKSFQRIHGILRWSPLAQKPTFVQEYLLYGARGDHLNNATIPSWSCESCSNRCSSFFWSCSYAIILITSSHTAYKLNLVSHDTTGTFYIASAACRSTLGLHTLATPEHETHRA